MEKFYEFIMSNSIAKIYVRRNINYSRMETHLPGYVAKASFMGRTSELEFLSIDDFMLQLKIAGSNSYVEVSPL